MKRRARERRRTHALIDGLHAIVDRLRSGESLRQALASSSEMEGSPLRPVAAALATGRPLALALREASSGCGDADLASALCVLAVHAEAGGDPLPCVRALTERVARRAAAREEARALTTQARLGARAILLLTPAFLVLSSTTDPRGAVSYVTQPRARSAIVLGLILQIFGAMWIGAIVRSVGATGALTSRVPVLRAMRALLAGRIRPQTDEECADAAEIIAFALDAGLSPTAAIAATAPYAPGAFGAALLRASSQVGIRIDLALAESVASVDSEAPKRFVRALSSSAELGVPLAPALRALVEDITEKRSIEFTEDIRRASVRVLIPLSLLVLPAFVLACLVPLFFGGLQGIAG